MFLAVRPSFFLIFIPKIIIFFPIFKTINFLLRSDILKFLLAKGKEIVRWDILFIFLRLDLLAFEFGSLVSIVGLIVIFRCLMERLLSVYD